MYDSQIYSGTFVGEIGKLESLRNWEHDERTQRRIDISQKTTTETTAEETIKIVAKEPIEHSNDKYKITNNNNNNDQTRL